MASSTYVVQSGDSLSEIAQTLGIPAEDILSENPDISDPDKIFVGQKLAVPYTEIRISMNFDGKELRVYTKKNGKLHKTESFQARSGLPKNSPAIPDLNKKHGLSLKSNIDYTDPKHDNVRFAGPIPGKTKYRLNLSQEMTYDKTKSDGDGAGWGVGGWLLKETFWNSLGGRNEFFLHHDGGNPGTAGCIGIVHGNDVRAIRRLLRQAYDNGQRKVVITVGY